ncbi:MAG: hypothetical protein HZB42_08960 [Sphingobacteriales bacterium]|nr:hypothetical protein [Sphingobacteriales bacterium]
MKFFALIVTVLFFLSPCTAQADSTNKKIKIEIPRYKNGEPDLFYQLDKQKAHQLWLDSLESGFDSLQIRIWYDYSLFTLRQLIVLKYTRSRWSADLYEMTVHWDYNKWTETILTNDTRAATPKSGWENFIPRLLALNITTLPNFKDVYDYGAGADGVTYNVEIADKYSYRFVEYWSPYLFKKKTSYAKTMCDILDLIRDEFSF